MKKRLALIATVLVLSMLFTSIAFADGTPIAETTAKAGELVVVGSVPKDGDSGKQISNMAVKIQFSEYITDEKNDAANEKLITIENAEGEKLDFQIVHHSKHQDELWLIIKQDLVSDTVYTVHLEPGIVGDSGNATKTTYETSFKTRNTKTDGLISTVLMVGMMVVMVFATKKSMTEQDAKNDKAPVEMTTETNPYKLSKEKGISLEEAKAEIEKEKEKNARKNKGAVKAREKAKVEAEAKEAAIEKRVQELRDAKHHKVKAPASVKAHGGKLPKSVQKKIVRYQKNPKRK